MLQQPLSETGSTLGMVAIPVVLLVVWLFNVYRTGRSKKAQGTGSGTGGKGGANRQLLMVGLGGLLLVAVLLAIWSAMQ